MKWGQSEKDNSSACLSAWLSMSLILPVPLGGWINGLREQRGKFSINTAWMSLDPCLLHGCVGGLLKHDCWCITITNYRHRNLEINLKNCFKIQHHTTTEKHTINTHNPIFWIFDQSFWIVTCQSKMDISLINVVCKQIPNCLRDTIKTDEHFHTHTTDDREQSFNPAMWRFFPGCPPHTQNQVLD